MTDKYILVNSVPTLETDLFAWAHWIERTNCNIAFTRVQEDISVSTVFLGLDYNAKEAHSIKAYLAHGQQTMDHNTR